MSRGYVTLIGATELLELQASQQPYMIFDCSFDLAAPHAGYAAYLDSHIAGAHYVHLEHDLSCKNDPTARSGGRHPLPSPEAFAAWLGAIGFTKDKQAVVYDRNNTMVAGRLWWMLQWIGHERAAVLDGGYGRYASTPGARLQAGSEPPRAAASALELATPLVRLVDAFTTAQHIGHAQAAIVDARASARYKGEIEPLDRVAGHIPSALNRPFTENFDAHGCFKAPEQLRQEFAVLLAGRDPGQTIHHCGSGVSAVPNVLAMAVAGLGLTALYAGSWSDWCSNPERPVAQG